MLAPDWPAGADVGVGDGDHTPLLAGAGLEAGHTSHPRVLPEVQIKSVLALKSLLAHSISSISFYNLKVQLAAAGVSSHSRVDA